MLAVLMGLLVVLGGGGCNHGECSCPAVGNSVQIHLECVPIQPPVVKTTGPCSFFVQESQEIILGATATGTCHVELTFGSGATSSVDLDITSMRIVRCCGESDVFVGSSQVSVPESACDAGVDAGLDLDAPSDTAVDVQADAGAGG